MILDNRQLQTIPNLMNALEFASRLVSFDSISRKSNVAVTSYAESTLASLGFAVERLEYDDAQGVRKACVIGKKGPGTGGVAYFGHTDVVPADPWFSTEHGPFQPTVKGGRLYGRRRGDMKSAV